jgi:hypothetical protein
LQEEVYVDVDRFMNAHEKAQEAADRSWGKEVYRDKPRFFLIAGLQPRSVYMFKVCAANLAGEGQFTEKVCVRTLAEGAAEVTPWVMAVDQKTHQAFYMHPRTQAVTWTLPPGVLIDQAESAKCVECCGLCADVCVCNVPLMLAVFGPGLYL